MRRTKRIPPRPQQVQAAIDAYSPHLGAKDREKMLQESAEKHGIEPGEAEQGDDTIDATLGTPKVAHGQFIGDQTETSYEGRTINAMRIGHDLVVRELVVDSSPVWVTADQIAWHVAGVVIGWTPSEGVCLVEATPLAFAVTRSPGHHERMTYGELHELGMLFQVITPPPTEPVPDASQSD